MKERWDSCFELGREESSVVISSFVLGVWEVKVQSGGRILVNKSVEICEVKSFQVVLSSSEGAGTVVKYG